ncbi:MAG: hypothetical protein IKO47_08395 [Ruminococcus sp.]|nr:hypothetical protein [Ruminococcus sp.]
MTPQLKNLLILLGAIAFVLLFIVMFFGSNSSLRLAIKRLLDGQQSVPVQNGRVSAAERRASAYQDDEQKSSNEPIVVMATLVRKCDEHRRVIESSGQEHYEDEYYELSFVTRKGKKLRIECSAEAYAKVPFNQQGSLTYKRNTLVKFKYYEDTVLN